MIEKIDAVAADIDMTLTAKGGDLPEYTKEVFRILQDRGVQIGLATGRELNDRLYNQWQQWKMDRPFDFLIGMNGGMLWDKDHGNFWNMDLMKEEVMKEILHDMMPIIEKYEVSVNVEGGENHAAMYIKGELFDSMRRRGWVFDDYTGDIDGVHMYHDYGHNPAEMKAALSVATMQRPNRLWAVMQPHTFSRVKALFEDYLTCTAVADFTLVTDICAAREKDPGDINSGMLVEGMRREGIDAVWTPSFDDTEAYLRARWQPGDLVLTMGCGDINMLNAQIHRHETEREKGTPD